MGAVRPPSRPAGRQRDATRTRTEMLDVATVATVATEECARLGCAGVRNAPVRLAARHPADQQGPPGEDLTRRYPAFPYGIDRLDGWGIPRSAPKARDRSPPG